MGRPDGLRPAGALRGRCGLRARTVCVHPWRGGGRVRVLALPPDRVRSEEPHILTARLTKALKPVASSPDRPGQRTGAGWAMVDVSEELIAGLKKKAVTLRKHIIRMTHNDQSGHPGGSMSACDIVTALYFHVIRVDPKRPDWPD